MTKVDLFNSEDIFELYLLILFWNEKKMCREKNILEKINVMRKKGNRKKIVQCTLNNQLKLLCKNEFIRFNWHKFEFKDVFGHRLKNNEAFGPFAHKKFKKYEVTRLNKFCLLKKYLSLNYKKVPNELKTFIQKEKEVNEFIWEKGVEEDYLVVKQFILPKFFSLFNYFLLKIVPKIQSSSNLTFNKMFFQLGHFLLINWGQLCSYLKGPDSNEWLKIFEKILIKAEPYFEEFSLTKKIMEKYILVGDINE